MKFLKYNWVTIVSAALNLYMFYNVSYRVEKNYEMITTGYLCIEKDINQHTQKMCGLLSEMCTVLGESEKDNQKTAEAAQLIIDNLEIVNENIKVIHENIKIVASIL